MSSVLDRAKDQLLSGILERDHVGDMCDIFKNSGKKQNFHDESVGRVHENNTGQYPLRIVRSGYYREVLGD